MRKGLLLCFAMFFLSLNAKDTLVVGYYVSPPFVEQTSDGDLAGISYWLWKKGFETSNDFHYEFKPYSNDGKPLMQILSDLKSGNLDVCLNPLTITPERNKDLQFSHPFYVSNLTIAVHKTSAWERAKEFFKGFFSPTFWNTVIALLLVILFFGFLVWLFERKRKESDFDQGFKGVLHGIWWSAVTMTTVGYGDKSPKTAGGRIIAFIWMFTAIIIISGFTASITTSLTVDRIKSDPGSLRAFKSKNVATVEGSATDTYLTEHYFRRKTTYPELVTGLEALQNEEFDAFIYDEPWLRHQIENTTKFPELEIVDLRFNVDLYAFAFRQGYNLQVIDDFNQRIIDIRESLEWVLALEEHHLSEI